MSDESLKRIQASLLRLKSQKTDPVEGMLESIFQVQAPEVVEFAKRCSIPRWFDPNLIVALADRPISVKLAEDILDKINDWEFVQDLGNGRFAFRREVRQHLLLQMKRDHVELARSLYQRCHSYFDSKLEPLGKLDELVWAKLQGEQASNMREKIYHLLQFDFESGFKLFQKLFHGAHRLYLIGEAAALLKFVLDLESTNWNDDIKNVVDYFKAMQRNTDGDRETALALLIDLKNRSIHSELRIQVLTLLGNIYTEIKEWDSAINVYQEAKELSDSLGLARQSAAISNNLGRVYLDNRDLTNADLYFQQAYAEFKNTRGQEEAQALNNLGNVRLKQEKRKEAYNFFEESIELKLQIGDRYGAAITQKNFGTLCLAISRDSHSSKTEKLNREKALENYLKSLDTFTQMGAVSDQASVLYDLALFYLQIQNKNQSAQYLRDAQSLFRAIGSKKDLENSIPLAKVLGL